MRLLRNPKLLPGLLVLALALPLASCGGGNKPLSAGSRPTRERIAPPARTPIPAPSVPCPGDPSRLCWTDEQSAQILAGMNGDIERRDAQLCWLLVWFGYEPCPAE